MFSSVTAIAVLAAVAAAADCGSSVQIHPKSNPNLCLDVAGNKQANGTPVQLYACNNTPAQQWTITSSGQVQLAGTNYCIDAGSSPGSGIKLKIWQCYNGILAQTWNWDGTSLSIKAKNQCLDVTNGGFWNANQMQTWQCYNGSPNQGFSTSYGNQRRSRHGRRACAVANTNSLPVSNLVATGGGSSNSNSGSSGSNSKSQFSPFGSGKKAGLAGGDQYDKFAGKIGWWYDWTADTQYHSTDNAVPMLWGGGNSGVWNDGSRFAKYKELFWNVWQSKAPKYVLGFNEPDCPTGDSSNINVWTAASLWNTWIAPLKSKGTLLISPAMCMQGIESWLGQFTSQAGINNQPDIIAVHIYQDNMADVQSVLDHYWNTYKKPMWVTEFACVHNPSNGFQSCSQNDGASFVYQAVDLFESNPNVYAYAPVNTGTFQVGAYGQPLTQIGWAYFNAISKYY